MNNQDLKQLADKCLLFNNFLEEESLIPDFLLQSHNESNKLVRQAFADKNEKVLKKFSSEIDNQVAKHIPLKLALKFTKLIKKELGIEYLAINRAMDVTINKIIKKGIILNDDEYEIILNYVDENFSDASKGDKIEKLNNLLADYHKRS